MRDPKPLSVAEFLSWEARQETGHELLDGAIVAMSSPTLRHGRLVSRVRRLIEAGLNDDCALFSGDMTVEIGVAAVRPDIVVTCDERDLADADAVSIRHPKLVVEVLSPSTSALDLGTKARLYLSLPNVEEYLMVDSRKRFVVLHRPGAATLWPADNFELVSVGLRTSLDEIYENIVHAS